MIRVQAARAFFLALAILADAPPASAQVFPETFADGLTGSYWARESPTPSGGVSVTERNGRLEISTMTSPSYADLKVASYSGRNWLLVMQGEIRARIDFSAQLGGVTTSPLSQSGLMVLFHDPDAPVTPTGLREGLLICLGSQRGFDGADYRVFSANRVHPDGSIENREIGYAPSSDPTRFRDMGSSTVKYTIPLAGRIFLRYEVAADRLHYSFTSYAGDDEQLIDDLLGVAPAAWVLDIGGFAEGQGALAGPTTWFDNVAVDQGAVQAAPVGFAATDRTLSDRVRLTWTKGAGTGVIGYRVLRKAPGQEFTMVNGGLLTAAATSFDDTTAQPGLTYEYKLMTRVATGEWLGVVDAGTRNLAAPTGVDATDGTSADGVTVTWGAASGAVTYEILRAVGSGSPVLLGATPASTRTFLDSSAVPGTIYNYSVRTRVAAGVSAASAVNPGWRNVPAPAGFTASDGTFTDKVALAWTASASTAVTGYRVLRTLPGGTETELALINGRTTVTFNDTSAAPGAIASYRVQARLAAGLSAAGAANTGWKNVPAPAGFTASDGTFTDKVALAWTASASTAVTGYRVLRTLPGGAEAQLALINGRTTVTFNDTSVAPGVVASYRVQARLAAGLSAAGAANTGFRRTASGMPSGGSAPSGDQGSSGTTIATLRSTAGGPAGTVGTPSAPTDQALPAGRTGLDASDGTAGSASFSVPSCEEVIRRIKGQVSGGAVTGTGARAERLLQAFADGDPLDCPACRMLEGDVDLDGATTDADLASWLEALEDGDVDTADLNRDEMIDGRDLGILLARTAVGAVLAPRQPER